MMVATSSSSSKGDDDFDFDFEEVEEDDDFDDDAYAGGELDADSLFNFDDRGHLKASAIKPHLRQMQEAVGSGSASLLDVRPANEHKKASRADALHVPLEALLLEDGTPSAALATLDASKPLYVFSSFTRTEDAYKAASALADAGFTDVRALDDSFEALQAQVPAA